ncbi:MAG: tRNA 2-thiouridine(34) synthase MnmA [bacterium]
MENKKGKVVCAMSGGVDSSVAAALLKKEGFEVVGVFIKFWSDESDGKSKSENRCCSSDSERRARATAAKLKIPFYVLNLEKEFKKRVVDYFLDTYKKGFTPNPCVVCNKEIKFGLLMEKALEWDADFIATGHYARNVFDSRNKIYRLYKGKDKDKDQSYFLWMLDQKQLSRVLFPVGEYKKEEVRRIAKKMGLSVFNIPDSQEVCFIPGEVNDFLKKYLKVKPGKIVDDNNKELGGHLGLHFYTIGQRRGMNLPGGPFFVLDKVFKRNILIVTKDQKKLFQKELKLDKINWISGEKPIVLRIKIKIRYRQKEARASIKILSRRKLKIVFDISQKAVTPGQSAVFYNKEELLGGAIIAWQGTSRK